jgi:hypothetical protein
MSKRLVLTATVLVVVGALGLASHLWLAMPPLRPHHGDGKFKDISWRWPWGTSGIPVRGYTIMFPTFALRDKYENDFHIRNLPDIGGCPVVYLCINDPEGRLSRDVARKQLTARVYFDVLDENGRSVCQVDQSLAKMYWADSEGAANCYGLYMLPDSCFSVRKGGRYLLHVRYTSDSQLSDFRGFVYIRCGGSI